MSEYQYELKHLLEYSTKDGEMAKAQFITLSAPSFKQLSHVAPIKQAFMAALTEIASGDADKDAEAEDTVTAAQVMSVLYCWSGDMTKILLHAAELFKSGAALVEGEAKLTQPLLDKIHYDDFDGLVGAYIANFIAPSLMDGL